MKNKIISILAVTIMGLAAVCYFQAGQLQERKTQISVLKNNLAEANDELQNTETALQSQKQLRAQDSELSYGLAAQVQELLKAKQETAQKLASLPKTQPVSDPEQNGLSGMVSKMLENPEMKKMMAAQQKVMMETMYAPLIKKLNLSPEEAAQFKSILGEQQIRATEQGLAMLNAKKEGSVEQAAQEMAQEKKQSDEQIRALLGDSRYAEYKDYLKTMGDRMVLDRFKPTDNPLNEGQYQQMLGILSEERQKVIPGKDQNPAAAIKELQSMFSSEQMEKHFQDEQVVNQTVYDRAKAVLSPEQLAAFGAFQSNQLHMQRLGMEMARGMFGTDKKVAPAAPP